MNELTSYVRFVRDAFVNGVGLLLVVTPASVSRMESHVHDRPGDLSQHFVRVGGYLRVAVASEAGQMRAELQVEEGRQLELNLHA